jgi:hypothetical protein
MCVTGYEADTGKMHTAEYGQPGGLLRAHTINEGFEKSVISHISLASVPFLEGPDVSSLSNWLTGEELDALESLR